MNYFFIFLLLTLAIIFYSRLQKFQQFFSSFIKRRVYRLPDDIIVDVQRLTGDSTQLFSRLNSLGYEMKRRFVLSSRVELVLFHRVGAGTKSFIDLLTNGEETTMALAQKDVKQQGGSYSDVTQASMVLFPDQRVGLPRASGWFSTCSGDRKVKTNSPPDREVKSNEYKQKDSSGTSRPSGPMSRIQATRKCLSITKTTFSESPGQAISFSNGSASSIHVALIDSKADFSAFPSFEAPLDPSDPYSVYINDVSNAFDDLDPGFTTVSEKHGTFMASLIASNYSGNHELKIRNYPFHDGEYGHLMELLASCYSAVHAGCRVINLSLGFFDQDSNPHLERFFEFAASKDVLIVCSAGNYNSDNDKVNFWPSNFSYHDNVIAVGATDNAGNKWSVDEQQGTNYGDISVDLAVRGESVKGFVDGTNIAGLSGTSCSATILTARAAEFIDQDPTISAKGVKTQLIAQINSGTGIFHG